MTATAKRMRNAPATQCTSHANSALGRDAKDRGQRTEDRGQRVTPLRSVTGCVLASLLRLEYPCRTTCQRLTNSSRIGNHRPRAQRTANR